MNIAIFASGSGTNAENMIRQFRESSGPRVSLIVCNNKDAGVLRRAALLNTASVLVSKEDLREKDKLMQLLKAHEISFIVLAGFLWLIPDYIIEAFRDRIINIHPALLPAHGGKGYFGARVHQAVLDSGAPVSGITIHRVNEKYDEGEIIFQAGCHIDDHETPESLAAKIHALEYRFYPVVLRKILRNIQ